MQQSAMKSIRLWLLVYLCLGSTCQAITTPTSYVAGIVEYFPYSEEDATDNVKKNLQAIEPLVEAAAKNGAQVVVFPEYGLTGASYTSRVPLSEQLERIPDNPSSGERLIPCNNSSFSNLPFFQKLSCLALSHNIALVVNTGDKQPCPTHSAKKCPPLGFYQYNTDIAFDSDGCYLAKYHKRHLYGFEVFLYDVPPLEIVSFTTKFGVTFGMFTCFDILFDSPAINLVEEGVKNLVFTTFWGSQFPTLISIVVQQSWSMLTSTNLIAANIHCQNITCLADGVPATGSGIYTNGMVLTSYISGELFHSGDGVLKYATVPAQPQKLVEKRWRGLKFGSNTNILVKTLEGATYKELDINSSSASINDPSGKVACKVDFKFKTKEVNERYAIGVLYGEESYGRGAFCVFVKCNESSCGDPVQQAYSVFQSIHLTGSFPENTTVYPFTLGNHFSLLDPQDIHFETNSLTLNGLDEPILAVSLWGCDQCMM